MDSLPSLAFSFARFVAREERRLQTRRHRTFGLAARRRNFSLNFNRRRNFGQNFNRRRNFGRNINRRQSMNGGLRHHRAVLGVPRRRYGPGGGLRRRHNHRQHYNHVHRRVQDINFTGTPRACTSAVVPREEVSAIPEVAVVPAVVTAAPEIATAVPEIVAVEPEVAAEFENDASASSPTADADELLPPPPALTVPPMDWLLGGPSAGWLVDDPDRDFSDDELEAQPHPSVHYYMRHGYGSCLPSPTPSEEEPEHFAPPGYALMTEFFEPPAAAPVDALSPALTTNLQMEMEGNEAVATARARALVPDLNHPAAEETKEENEDAPPAPSLALPTPSPEARVLLRRFASAMAVRPAGIRRGTWCPEALGLTNRVAELRLNEATHHSSSSAEGSSGR
ncbi:uncharacterized protein [Lolium perenne]|uniref:uncharacterized protein n=1 Tax=Lolium perenne TaxID=4522 RepID=UPI0021EB3016